MNGSSSSNAIWKDLTQEIERKINSLSSSPFSSFPFFQKGKLYKSKFRFGCFTKLMSHEDIEKEIYKGPFSPCISTNFCYMFLGIYGRIDDIKKEGENVLTCFKFLGPEGRNIYVPCYTTIEDFSRNYFDNEFEEAEETSQ